MELIYSDPYYGSGEEEPGRFARELRAELATLDSAVHVREADIGRGADWPVVLVELFGSIDWPAVASVVAGPVAVFFLGEKIQKNTRAWLDMARRPKQLLAKRPVTRIDEQAALLLTLDELCDENVKLDRVEISVQVVELVTLASGKGTLDKRPEAVYLITVVSAGETRLFAIESNGNVAFKRRFAEPRLR